MRVPTRRMECAEYAGARQWIAPSPITAGFSYPIPGRHLRVVSTDGHSADVPHVTETMPPAMASGTTAVWLPRADISSLPQAAADASIGAGMQGSGRRCARSKGRSASESARPSREGTATPRSIHTAPSTAHRDLPLDRLRRPLAASVRRAGRALHGHPRHRRGPTSQRPRVRGIGRRWLSNQPILILLKSALGGVL